MLPLQTGEMTDFERKSSRAWVLDRCTSITGMSMAATASRSATDVWVYPAGLNTTPRTPRAACRASINSLHGSIDACAPQGQALYPIPPGGGRSLPALSCRTRPVRACLIDSSSVHVKRVLDHATSVQSIASISIATPVCTCPMLTGKAKCTWPPAFFLSRSMTGARRERSISGGDLCGKT
jgi:hypothetical protein